jgi:hypothetical protein
MLARFALLSGLAVVGVFGAPMASAAPQAPSLSVENAGVVQQAQWWDIDRCRAWRRECADRWGWGSERFHRCLWRHGCERHRYYDRWDRWRW